MAIVRICEVGATRQLILGFYTLCSKISYKYVYFLKFILYKVT